LTPSTSALAEYQGAAALRSALRAFVRRAETAARRAGLTPQRQLLLLMIKGAPDGSECATVTDLARRLELAQNSVTDLVSRAEAAGLVAREASARDGRVMHLRLTGEGERRLDRAVTDLRRDRRELLEILLAATRRHPPRAGGPG
jgi:DNA-binding MarR family transcriptional regulator